MSKEILQLLDQIVYEKDIPKRDVIEAVEGGFEAAAPAFFDDKYKKLQVVINPHDGEISLFALKRVVEKVEDEDNEITADDAEEAKKAFVAGGYNDLFEDDEEEEEEEELTFSSLFASPADSAEDDEKEAEEAVEEGGEFVPVRLDVDVLEFSRTVVYKAKSVILSKVHDAVRKSQFQYYKKREGSVINGVVSYIMPRGDIIVNLGKLDGILLKSNQAVDEDFQKNERIKVYIQKVHLAEQRVRIELSRIHEGLIKHIFAGEVPEVHDGLVVIKTAVRDRIGRVKVLVESRDKDVDAVGACVGVRGSRVKGVISELKEERIDIVPYVPELRTQALKALGCDEVERFMVDDDEKRITIVVQRDILRKFIGKKGQNVRLASRLIGWDINIMHTEEFDQLQGESADEGAGRSLMGNLGEKLKEDSPPETE